MIEHAIHRLEKLLNEVSPRLLGMEEMEFNAKPNPNKWSKKEIIGHLIDSATNNIRRFILGQYENNPTIVYDQDKWCELNYYQLMEHRQIIALWEILNRQLIFLWKQLSPDMLLRKANDQTLMYLITDYIAHMEHHLKQILQENEKNDT